MDPGFSLFSNVSSDGTEPWTSASPQAGDVLPDTSGSLSVPAKILLETIIILMCLGAITGNILVIVIIAVTKNFHSVTSVFLVNLAVSDCLVGLGVMPFVAMSIFYKDWNKYNNLCLYVGYTSSVYCTASILTLAAIALDRYHAIIDCLQYNSQTTVRRTVATVVWIWLQAAISSCPPLLGWGRFSYSPALYSCSVEWTESLSYTGFVSALSFLLPTSVMIFCYVRIVKVARGHAKRIHDIENQLQRNVVSVQASQRDKPTFSKLISSVNSRIISEETTSSSDLGQHPGAQGKKQDMFSKYSSPGREYHGAFRLFMVIFAFFCCWMPSEIVSLVRAIETALSDRPSSVPPTVVTVVHWLALLNSDINPLLYALLSKRFRKALRNLQQKLRAKFHLRARRETSISVFHTNPPFKQRRTSSNVTGISHISPHEQRFNGRSCSVFSISSFPHSGVTRPDELFDDFLSAHISTPDSQMLAPHDKVIADNQRDSALLKGDLSKQYLKVPQLSLEVENLVLPSQTVGERQSTYVFGNIVVKVENDALDL